MNNEPTTTPKKEASPSWENLSLPPTARHETWRWDNWYLELSGERRRALANTLRLKCAPEVIDCLRGSTNCFITGHLAAPRRYRDGVDGPEQHHFHSTLGVGVTPDFTSFYTISDDAFRALPKEGSIWTGSFIQARSKDSPCYYFFYTHRDRSASDPLAQRISVAKTADFLNFERTSLTLQADPRWYETASLPLDTSIHAFRDPFPFELNGRAYLLVTAKSRLLPPGRIGQTPGENGVIAVYRATKSRSVAQWEATPLCFSVGSSEAEVPSLYYDATHKQHVILYSCKTAEAYLARTLSADGNAAGTPNEAGETRLFTIKNLQTLLNNPPTQPVAVKSHNITAPTLSGYAYRFTPDGRLLGFNCIDGGPSVLAGRKWDFEMCSAGLKNFIGPS